MSAKKIIIDWDKVDEYLKAQCSGSGIAEILGIHENTLYDHCKSDKGMEFMAYSAKKKSEGKELLRKKQIEVAMSGDKVMLVWLGKQYLGQSDKTETEHNIKGSGLRIGFEDDEHSG